MRKILYMKTLWCMGACLCLLLQGACTVREDRGPCPCYVDVDYRQVLSPTHAYDPAGRVEVAFFDAATDVGTDCRWTDVHGLDDCPEEEEVAVDKGTVRVVAVVHDHPLRHYLSDGTKITYAAGNEMDPLYVHTEQLDCTEEWTRCILQPHKQFSTLTFTDEQDGALCRQYHLLVRGTTCGLDAADLSAVEGPYLYTVQDTDAEGAIQVRIPRQLRDDLLLEFWEKREQRLLFTCPVGLYLFAAGYDPRAKDLPDYSLRIDFRQAQVYLRVADWTEEIIYSLYE